MYRKDWNALKDYDNQIEVPMYDVKSEGSRIFPREQTRVIAVGASGKMTLPNMTYSLVPTWSKEPVLKWATYNARLERKDPKTGDDQKIFEVPTWRDYVGKQHCVIPVSEFFESCSEGGSAEGFEVAFHKQDFSDLFIAGLFSVWRGLVENKPVVACTFAAITTEPSDYIKSIGHDRSPLFLSKEYSKLWITEKFESGEPAYNFLKKYQIAPTLTHTKIRKLKGAS